MPEVIGAELHLKTVRSDPLRSSHDPGVRDDRVERFALGKKPFRTRPRTRWQCWIEFYHFQTTRSRRRGPDFFGRAVGFLHFPCGADYMGTMGDERAGYLRIHSQGHTPVTRTRLRAGPFLQLVPALSTRGAMIEEIYRREVKHLATCASGLLETVPPGDALRIRLRFAVDYRDAKYHCACHHLDGDLQCLRRAHRRRAIRTYLTALARPETSTA